jgi:hypothetical protein
VELKRLAIRGVPGSLFVDATHGACMKITLALLTATALFAVSPSASAQKKGNVITIGEVTIVGRVQKPIASVDVSKISPKLTLAELRQPFLDRIEEAVRKDPF